MFLAPDAIDLTYQDGRLEYEERFEVGDLEQPAVDKLIERSMVFGEMVDLDAEQDGDVVTMRFEMDATAKEALGAGATELMLMLKAAGGDVDFPWHAAHAMGAGPSDVGAILPQS